MDLAGRTGTMAESGVCEGAMVQTPTPPTKTGRKLRAADRPVRKEVGCSRRNDGLGDEGKIFVRPCRRGAHSEASHIGAHRILVRPAIVALTVRTAISALTMINLDH